jgi:hypothetical protein
MMKTREWWHGPFARLRGRAFVAVAWLILAGLFSQGAMAQEVMSVAQNMPGFKASSVYENFGNGESVNAFNGGLTVAHPSSISLPQNMGGMVRLTFAYNSKHMDDIYAFGGDEAPGWTGIDKPHGVLGFGWTLSLGRVLARTMQHEIYGSDPLHPTYETRVFYYYQDETGAEHKLYRDSAMENWGNAATEPSTSWYFTNDGSYIRAKYDISVHQWTIYFPNGSKSIAGGAENVSFIRPVVSGYMTTNPYTNGWYVTKIIDRAGNFTTITYNAYDATMQPYAGAINTINDQFGRTISFA